jgi:transcriptional regulator with XRE-family HTH domain
MHVYQRLRDLREDADLTQKQVAALLYMHLTQYRRYECGESELPMYLAIRLAELYDVSLDYIAGMTDSKRGLTQSSLGESETRLIEGFRQLDPVRQGRLLERLEMLRTAR